MNLQHKPIAGGPWAALLFLVLVIPWLSVVAEEGASGDAKEVPFGDNMGAEVTNYNRLRPHIATGGTLDLSAIPQLKAKGFKTIIDLRTPEEGTAEEKTAVEATGMHYVNLPVAKGRPSDEQIQTLAEILADSGNRPVLIHCASGNRVGTAWAIYRLQQGIPLEIAIEEGRTAGMRPSREAQVRTFAESCC
ncbi:fused DSP-PTPase phosphatase/NAD kinase-like protein [Microbulbifer celer]|uniref:Beta-lactamase hydrolase domain-containing protein n=1 Tax=Microbulbifer celer TaxID=435905 RepID=A0ABW3U9T2_9GAMM|nr:protein tyrosine phosphatase family protein [Microbulbifer celer]UFN58731.1 protein tyrosine phosphatase family protein [Microbulbifer celer]